MTSSHLHTLLSKGLIRGATENGKPIVLSEPEKPKAKYRNKKIEVDGMKFDSKREACRYRELKFLAGIGEVFELRTQVTYQLSVCKYIADFVYRLIDGTEVCEDVKSEATRKLPVFAIKRKMMLAELGITIKIVK